MARIHIHKFTFLNLLLPAGSLSSLLQSTLSSLLPRNIVCSTCCIFFSFLRRWRRFATTNQKFQIPILLLRLLRRQDLDSRVDCWLRASSSAVLKLNGGGAKWTRRPKCPCHRRGGEDQHGRSGGRGETLTCTGQHGWAEWQDTRCHCNNRASHEGTKTILT